MVNAGIGACLIHCRRTPLTVLGVACRAVLSQWHTDTPEQAPTPLAAASGQYNSTRVVVRHRPVSRQYSMSLMHHTGCEQVVRDVVTDKVPAVNWHPDR
jgi:hypothetical protein